MHGRPPLTTEDASEEDVVELLAQLELLSPQPKALEDVGVVAVAFGDAEETSKPKRAGDDARGGTRRRACACARECARAASSARARRGVRGRRAAAEEGGGKLSDRPFI